MSQYFLDLKAALIFFLTDWGHVCKSLKTALWISKKEEALRVMTWNYSNWCVYLWQGGLEWTEGATFGDLVSLYCNFQ